MNTDSISSKTTYYSLNRDLIDLEEAVQNLDQDIKFLEYHKTRTKERYKPKPPSSARLQKLATPRYRIDYSKTLNSNCRSNRFRSVISKKHDNHDYKIRNCKSVAHEIKKLKDLLICAEQTKLKALEFNSETSLDIKDLLKELNRISTRLLQMKSEKKKLEDYTCGLEKLVRKLLSENKILRMHR